MSIVLPEFNSPYCTLMTVCGQVLGGEIKEDQEELVARYGQGDKLGYVRLFTNNNHLHIDCASKKNFPEKKIPKPTHKKAEIIKYIELYLGKEIECGVIGYFEININEIPVGGLIRSTYSEKKGDDNFSMKLTGATLAFTGMPIQNLEWRESSTEEGKILIKMRGKRKLPLDEDYLLKLWDWINKLFNLFILDVGTIDDESSV